MRAHQILTIAVLTMLLNFKPFIVWADKKTAIIAGSAGGAAATVIGGTLWYKLINRTGRIEVEVDGEPVQFSFYKQGKLISVLQEKGFNQKVIRSVNYLFNNKVENMLKEDKKANIKILIKTEEKRILFRIERNGILRNFDFIDKETGSINIDLNMVDISNNSIYSEINNIVQPSQSSKRVHFVEIDENLKVPYGDDINFLESIENDVE